jgi:hypothetical protein
MGRLLQFSLKPSATIWRYFDSPIKVRFCGKYSAAELLRAELATKVKKWRRERVTSRL